MAGRDELQVGHMEITIFAGGEEIRTVVPQGSTIEAVFQGGHLRGVQAGAAAFRVNGGAANGNTILNPNDQVQAVPIGGKLAN